MYFCIYFVLYVLGCLWRIEGLVFWSVLISQGIRAMLFVEVVCGRYRRNSCDASTVRQLLQPLPQLVELFTVQNVVD